MRERYRGLYFIEIRWTGGSIMIILTELATKLENILNSLEGFTNPTPYLFKVKTEGFHIDYVYDKNEKKNFIPVFISSMGGTHNPVPQLKQASQTVSVVLYYPVRFKDDFYALYDFLVDVFVGTNLYYGDISGHAISNISVPQYGELQDLDLTQFKKWVDENYGGVPIEVMQTYMSMQFTLYLTTAGDAYLWGNDVTATITATINGTTYTNVPVVFDDGSLQSNSQTQSEQELGTSEALGLPFGTAYGSSFRMYIQSDTTENQGFYTALLLAWFTTTLQELSFDLNISINGLTFTRKCFVSSINLPIQKGQILSATVTYSPRIEEA